VERDYGGTERLRSSSTSKTLKKLTIADLLAKAERDGSSFKKLLTDAQLEQKEENIKFYHDDSRQTRRSNYRDDRDYHQSRKRSRSRSKSKSREYRNYMATIELSKSSENFY